MPSKRRPDKPLSPLPDTDPDVFWDVKELTQRGIVRGWGDLWTKQREYGFPKGVALAGRRRSFRAIEVRKWVADREAAD